MVDGELGFFHRLNALSQSKSRAPTRGGKPESKRNKKIASPKRIGGEMEETGESGTGVLRFLLLVLSSKGLCTQLEKPLRF